MSQTPDAITVIVAGGGAAGFFAAVNAARKNPRLSITLLEAAGAPLQKVRISGGGRCNLTHHCFDPARLIEFYPRGQKELRSLFARFQPKDTMAWFESRGLKLKHEADGRVFPVSDSSEDVIAVLVREAAQYGVKVHTGRRVTGIIRTDTGFEVSSGEYRYSAQIVIMATGYSPPGWQIARELGHSVLNPVPSLFPFTVKSPVIEGLQGISVLHARGRLTVDKPQGKPERIEAEGPVLITHTGLSGPLIYRLSAWGARALAESKYQGRLQIDLLPELEEEALRQQLAALFATEAKKKLANTDFAPLSHRLWLALLSASEADLEGKAEGISKKTLNKLVENLKRLPLSVSGKSPSKEEFVSCGGVPRHEVDFKTMQSRKVPGLYFGGEILDIDGLTGGFNFQSCWSQGWAISEALASL